MKPVLDTLDRTIVNRLQEGLALVPEPYAAVAAELGIAVDDLLARLARLRSAGLLSRVGPMYNAARFGGGLTLCAMAVPEARFEEVTAVVNAFPEVAHNYARDHAYNMWFVLATENEADVARVIGRIEVLTDIKVLNLPKLDEYFIGMKVDA